MKGYIASLFDFEFTSFIAPKIIRVFYKIAIGLMALGTLSFALVGFSNGFFAGLGTMLIAPLFFILYATLVRIGFETTMAQFQVLERVNQIAAILGGGGTPMPGADPNVPLDYSQGSSQSPSNWGSPSNSQPARPSASSPSSNGWASNNPTPASSSTPASSWGSDSPNAGLSGTGSGGGAWGQNPTAGRGVDPTVIAPISSTNSSSSTPVATSPSTAPSDASAPNAGRTQIVSPSSLEGWQGNSQPTQTPPAGGASNGWSTPNEANKGSNNGWNS